MRKRGRVDQNHSEIVAALRAIGAGVVSIAGLGDSVPDLLVGYRGVNHILEVKRPGLKDHAPKDRGERERLERQAAWAEAWPAPVHRVYSVDDAIAAVTK